MDCFPSLYAIIPIILFGIIAQEAETYCIRLFERRKICHQIPIRSQDIRKKHADIAEKNLRSFLSATSVGNKVALTACLGEHTLLAAKTSGISTATEFFLGVFRRPSHV